MKPRIFSRGFYYNINEKNNQYFAKICKKQSKFVKKTLTLYKKQKDRETRSEPFCD